MTRSAAINFIQTAAILFAICAFPLSMRPAFATDVRDLQQVIEPLELWLDRDGTYPPAPYPPLVRLIAPEELGCLGGNASTYDERTRGLYLPQTATIYLVKPWSSDNMQDVSVLLHELVHQRQQFAGHWYCEGAKEQPAYELQRDWLEAQGEQLRVNWIEVVLMAGCSRRDIHPD